MFLDSLPFFSAPLPLGHRIDVGLSHSIHSSWAISLFDISKPYVSWIDIHPLTIGFIISAALSLLGCFILLKCGPIDRPRSRGAHVKPTPTSAGMAIMSACALSLGLVLTTLLPHLPSSSLRDGFNLFIFASCLGLFGALDDLLGLPASLKLGVQILCALAFSYIYDFSHITFGFGLSIDFHKWVSMILTTLWLVLGMNTINFMDGSNGLAIGAQSVALAIIVLVLASLSPNIKAIELEGLLLVCVCALGAKLGFIPYNLPKGLMFQGDAGSLFGGAMITGAVLILKHLNISSIWFGGYILAPLLVDVILTLIDRTYHKAPLFKAHSQHLYQLWLKHKDPSHVHLALRIWGLCALSGALAVCLKILLLYAHIDLRFTGLVILLCLYSLGWMTLRRQLGFPFLTPRSEAPEPR